MRHLAFVAALSVATIASPQSQQVPRAQDEFSDYQQIRTNDALETIASQLSAMREQTARIEKQRTEREANPFWPPVPSNWLLILLTCGAVAAAFKTLVKLERQTKAAEQSAAAAATSANAALISANFTAAQKRISDKQLRLLYTPCFELERPSAKSFDIDDTHATVQVLWTIRNTGAAPIHFRGIESTVAANDLEELVEHRGLVTSLGVGRGLEIRSTSNSLTPDNVQAYKAGRLVLRNDMTISIFDPISDKMTRHRRFRRILCGVGRDDPADFMGGAIDEQLTEAEAENQGQLEAESQPKREDASLSASKIAGCGWLSLIY